MKAELLRTRRLNFLYKIALGTVALIAILSQIIIQWHLSKQEGDAHTVNLAGRQRMLSQYITKCSLLISMGDTTYTLPLKNALVLWEKERMILLGMDKTQLEVAVKEAAVNILFENINEPFENIRRHANYLLNKVGRKNKQENTYHISQILNSEAVFLRGMENIVNKLDQINSEKVNSLRWIELILVLITILTLITEAIFIFNPAIIEIKKGIKQMSDSHKRSKHTSQKLSKLNQALKQSGTEMREIMNSLKQTSWLLRMSVSGELRYVNKKIQDSLGLERSKLKNKYIHQYIKNELKPELLHLFTDKPSARNWHGELLLEEREGNTLKSIWLYVTIVPVSFGNTNELEYLLLGSDITRQKEASEESQRNSMEELEKQINMQRISSFSIITGQEQERKRMAREMHDGIGQMLTALKFNVEAFPVKTSEDTFKIQNIKSLLMDTIKEVKRVSSDLLPSELEHFGLAAALKVLVNRMSHLSDTEIRLSNNFPNALSMNKNIEIAFYRIAQEALNNSLKYSKASIIKIVLQSDSEFISLSIIDDGQGFEMEKVLKPSDNRFQTNGLNSMQERAKLVNANMVIKTSVGKGTNVFVELANYNLRIKE